MYVSLLKYIGTCCSDYGGVDGDDEELDDYSDEMIVMLVSWWWKLLWLMMLMLILMIINFDDQDDNDHDDHDEPGKKAYEYWMVIARTIAIKITLLFTMKGSPWRNNCWVLTLVPQT